MMTASQWLKEVWNSNLEEEMERIRAIVDEYPFVAMDTEFPGVVARPIGTFRNSSDYHYQTLRCNVDLLKIIQIGLTFTDGQGNYPPGTSTWQFNFRFSVHDDMYAQESLDLLTKAGINFKKNKEDGIEAEHFGELLITSGLVLIPEVKWISFHSGYDFGYLLKVVSCASLPSRESEFFELLKIWFPCIYDIKYLMKSCKTLKGGLQEVADDLAVVRLGVQHQAGSDSHLTASTFFKMRTKFFEDAIDDTKYLGYLYGLGQALQQQQGGNTGPTAMLSKEGPEPNLSVNSMSTPEKAKINHVFSVATANTPSPLSHAIQIKDPFANGFGKLEKAER